MRSSEALSLMNEKTSMLSARPEVQKRLQSRSGLHPSTSWPSDLLQLFGKSRRVAYVLNQRQKKRPVFDAKSKNEENCGYAKQGFLNATTIAEPSMVQFRGIGMIAVQRNTIRLALNN